LVRAIWRSCQDPDFQGLSFLVVTLLFGTLFYRQSEGWGLLDSLYFSVVTLTTVGYGDLSPSTAAGKAFTILYIFVGLSVVPGFVDAVAGRSQERQSEAHECRRRGAWREIADSESSARVFRTLTGNWGVGSMRGTGEGRW